MRGYAIRVTGAIISVELYNVSKKKKMRGHSYMDAKYKQIEFNNIFKKHIVTKHNFPQECKDYLT